MMVCCVSAIWVSSLVSAVFLMSAFSFFTALLWALLGAPDVAFTEAMIGIGVSTIFFMLALYKTKNKTSRNAFYFQPIVGAIVCLLTMGFFIWFSQDLPLFGDSSSAASTYLSPYYIKHAYHDLKTPNLVTSILADYRSFDTLLETAVVFIAGLACLLIMKRPYHD
jgi:multicomponent Na+:H+ antiporter subunit B